MFVLSLRPCLVLASLLAASCAPFVHARTPAVARDDGPPLTVFVMDAAGAGPHAAILYLDGSTCASVAQVMAYLKPFSDAGLAVVAPEKRGVSPGDTGISCSAEYLATNDRLERTAAAKLALRRVGDLVPGWDGRVIVVATSEGTVFAPEIAAGPSVVGLALLGGGGMSQAWELEVLKRKELTAAHATGGDIAHALAELDAAERAILADPTSTRTWLGPDNTYRRWASYLTYEPMEALRRVRVPILMINGGRDQATPIESAEAVRSELAATGEVELRLVRYEDLDHEWRDASGQRRIDRLARDLTEWVEAVEARTRDRARPR